MLGKLWDLVVLGLIVFGVFYAGYLGGHFIFHH
jgi:hypothetical protein